MHVDSWLFGVSGLWPDDLHQLKNHNLIQLLETLRVTDYIGSAPWNLYRLEFPFTPPVRMVETDDSGVESET
ncbi:uncharacterized protein EI90DRAFT_3116756 [Cantharellus anzutake]|uniref:uncharacterized protein n=1 Tax=Cantharellus anzutake TaxID=1750568 RepID=UPI0019053569|nr:uncharacterized protein EI90DRAFT_3116756 [Cantharellus anzutake]KAF8341659.1 hypothetical protein EI90DRAFT_3116756 [Cantharellus anzutake]